MKEYIIATGTITYALKGRDLLRKNGINARVERMTNRDKNRGCGYVIIVIGDLKNSEILLKAAGIKILEIIERA